MQRITPHLWYDKEAKDAATLYTSLFEDSSITYTTTLADTPSGDSEVVAFRLAGQEFMAISAGPLFKFNPSVSFTVACSSAGEVDRFWSRLSEGGAVMMELGAYPFSERFGWLADRFGLSWQIMSTGGMPIRQKITPAFLFVGDVCGKTEEAVRFWASVHKNGGVGKIQRYAAGEEPDKEGTVKHAEFTLDAQEFTAMDSAHAHQFSFNEAISLIVRCRNQAEIDYYWGRLSAVPEAEQCGWLKDRYGVSWQVAPTAMDRMLREGTKEQIARVTQAFLPMKKFDLAQLEAAYRGK